MAIQRLSIRCAGARKRSAVGLRSGCAGRRTGSAQKIGEFDEWIDGADMKPIFLACVFALASLPLPASVLVSVDEPSDQEWFNAIFATSWTQTGTHDDVSV